MISSFTFNAEYVEKLKAGNPDVERHFYSHFGELLRIKLRSKLRSPQLIEDVRQETFLRVLKSLHKPDGLQNPERLGPFINSVCNNVMMEAFRSDGRHRQMPEEAPDIVDESADPARETFRQEMKVEVARILDELPEKDRALLRMVFYEEMEKGAICKEMNVNAEYLRVLIHRAKSKFRTALARSGVNNQEP